MKRFAVYLLTRPIGMASVAVIALLYLVMVFAEAVAPHPPTAMFPEHTYHPPNARIVRGRLVAQEWVVTDTIAWSYARVSGRFHDVRLFGEAEPFRLWGAVPGNRRLLASTGYPLFLMGADHMGRCVFSRIVHGSRISLTIGLIVTAISMILGVFFGGIAGYYGGMADAAVMRLCEFLMLIPGLYLILFVRSLFVGAMDPGQLFVMMSMMLALVGWPGIARTIRGMVHAIKREEFVLNAQLEMIPSPVIIGRFIVPQTGSLLIVGVALSVPGAIMAETALSFLGLGIQDPSVSWGSLIRRDVLTLWNVAAFPWLLNPIWFILAITLAFNFMGDALRDYFDPYHTIFRRPGKGLLRGMLAGLGDRLRGGQGSRNVVRGTGDRGLGSGEPGIRNRGLTGLEPVAGDPGIDSQGSDSGIEARETLAGDPGMGSPVPLLEVRDLRVSFMVRRGKSFATVPAVRCVSFGLERGECLGIVGESGSGKSVSTIAIPGLLPRNAQVSGSIRYEGRELAGLGTKALREYRGRKIGMIFQEPGRSFDPLQNMGSAFLETFRNSEPGISKEEAFRRAAELLAETGLERGRERLVNYPHQFSGGQLQRIGIALALAQGCDLLIADEPTTALDVTIQKQIVELLKTLRRTRGISIVFISHDIELVAEISDRIIVMYGGMVMESGTPPDVTGNPRHPYTRALLASSPRFGSHHTLERLTSIPGSSGDGLADQPGCPFAPRCGQAGPECSRGVPPLAVDGVRELRCVNAGLEGGG